MKRFRRHILATAVLATCIAVASCGGGDTPITPGGELFTSAPSQVSLTSDQAVNYRINGGSPPYSVSSGDLKVARASIDGGGLSRGSEAANVLQSTLQNTLEQSVLAVLVHLAWSVLLPATWISAIPAAVILFLCGRVLFLRGYRGGAASRAIGFALTFYPSVLMLVVVVVAAVLKMFRWS